MSATPPSQGVETLESVLRIEVDQGVALLTMTRPKRLNALSRALIAALDGALDRFEDDPDVRVLVVTGGPRADGRPCFCAGADLHELAQGGAGAVGEREFDVVRDVGGVFEGDNLGASGIRRMMHRIETYPKPVIAAIDGPCTAGGIELALSCDLRIASETAQISDLHLTNLAHTGGSGATSRLSRLIGPSQAKEMIFLGLVLDGQEAHRRRVVNRVVAPADLVPVAVEMARTIAQQHPIALRLGKALADASVDLSREQALRYDYLSWTAQMMTTGGYAGAQKFSGKGDPPSGG